MIPGVQTFNTSDVDLHWVKLLVHGPSGAGKTQLIQTVEEPDRSFIMSAEAGLLSIAGSNMKGAVISKWSDLGPIYAFLRSDSDEAKKINFVHIDSITELGDICLTEELPEHKNKLQAYGEYARKMAATIKLYRDLPKHVYMSCKETTVFDDNNFPHYGLMFHGKKLAPNVPGDFDIVATIRVFADPENEGALIRKIQTVKDPNYGVLKDRSGALGPFIDPNFKTMFAAIRAKFPNLS